MKRRLKSLGILLLVAALAVIPANAAPNLNSLKNEKEKLQKEIESYQASGVEMSERDLTAL